MASPLNVSSTSRAEPTCKAGLAASLIIAAILCAQGASLLHVRAQGLQRGAAYLVPTTSLFEGSLGPSLPTVLRLATNQSTLTVFVGVRDGRLAVDRAKSAREFKASDEFLRRLGTGTSAAQVAAYVPTICLI